MPQACVKSRAISVSFSVPMAVEKQPVALPATLNRLGQLRHAGGGQSPAKTFHGATNGLVEAAPKRFSKETLCPALVDRFKEATRGLDAVWLLCAGPTADHCHRRLLAEYFKNIWRV